MSSRSPNHGEIDDGGVVWVRERAWTAYRDVGRAAVNFLHKRDSYGLENLDALRVAVDRLLSEIGVHKEV